MVLEGSVHSVKPSFHKIAHDRRIAENTVSDRQRLYGNTFQRSGDRRRTWAIVRFSDSSDPAIVMSDHMETRFY